MNIILKLIVRENIVLFSVVQTLITSFLVQNFMLKVTNITSVRFSSVIVYLRGKKQQMQKY
jgi:hypothetical protein